MNDFIRIKNARLHNLKDINVEIPIGKTTLVSGVSGGGKSSLIIDILGKVSRHKFFDLLHEPGLRSLSLFLEEEEYVDLIEPVCPAILFTGQAVQRNPRSTVGSLTGLNRLIKNLFRIAGDYRCPRCKNTVKASTVEEMVATLLEVAQGKKTVLKAPLDFPLSADQRRMALIGLQGSGYLRIEVDGHVFMMDEEPDGVLQALEGKDVEVNLIIDRVRPTHKKNRRLFDSVRTALKEGIGRVVAEVEMEKGRFGSFYFSTSLWCPRCRKFLGEPKETSKFTCVKSVSRLDRALRTFSGVEMNKLLEMPLSQVFCLLSRALREVASEKESIYLLLRRIIDQLKSIDDLDIGHLNLSRPVTIISTGESLKLCLSSLFAQRFVGALFILDEPVSLLPTAERLRICQVIDELKKAGNTVVIIDHAPEVFDIADYFIEIGPGAGEKGGRVVRHGWIYEKEREKLRFELRGVGGDVKTAKKAPVAGSGQISIPLSDYFTPRRSIEIVLGGLNVITGPTGSGKSRLLGEINVYLEEKSQLNSKVLAVPQAMIYKSKYSIPATVLKVFGSIRILFSRTKEARSYGLGAQLFSLAKKGGRCDTCKGTGVAVKDGPGYEISCICPVCKGARYNSDILSIRYRGLNIDEVLKLSIHEAAGFFSNVSEIRRPLEIAERVGIGYLRLGQPTSSLSAGEAQRLKIASHLARIGRANPGFILMDQPTAGLHPRDIDALSGFFRELLEFGATVIAVDNNCILASDAAQIICLSGTGPTGGRITR